MKNYAIAFCLLYVSAYVYGQSRIVEYKADGLQVDSILISPIADGGFDMRVCASVVSTDGGSTMRDCESVKLVSTANVNRQKALLDGAARRWLRKQKLEVDDGGVL